MEFDTVGRDAAFFAMRHQWNHQLPAIVEFRRPCNNERSVLCTYYAQPVSNWRCTALQPRLGRKLGR